MFRTGRIPLGGVLLIAVSVLLPAGGRTILSAKDYTSIDQHALDAPDEVENSLESLVDYLVAPARNERERLRVIFRWITDNIEYDAEGSSAGPATLEDVAAAGADSGGPGNDAVAERVLRNRRADCDGYSTLMDALTRRTGLEIHQVKGFAKGFGYRVGSGFSGTNHAWNAVELDGSWFFIDCTWGAGYPDADRRFVKQFEPYYFLTRPEELIYTHFPEQPEWQKIARPLDKVEFIGKPFLWPFFFRHGMRLAGDYGSTIESGRSLEITIVVPDSVLLDADMIEGRRLMQGQYAFVQRPSPDSCVIRAVFPRPGDYVLRVFAKLRSSEGASRETIDFRVLAGEGDETATGFPYAYEAYYLHDASLMSPLEGTLSGGGSYFFSLKVPGASSVSVMDGPLMRPLVSRGGVFEGPVEVGSCPVEVYAEFEGSGSYECLLEYDCPPQ